MDKKHFIPFIFILLISISLLSSVAFAYHSHYSSSSDSEHKLSPAEIYYFKNVISPILSVLILLSLPIPFFIYLKYGREPKIKYYSHYERDLPTEDPPAIVNAICSISTKVGEADLNGFKATIMDLINRKYLSTEEVPYEESAYPDSIYLKINHEKDQEVLWNFEKKVMSILSEYETDEGLVCMDLISESLYYTNSANFFYSSYKEWKKQIKEILSSDEKLKQVFSNKGDNYIKLFGVYGIVVGPSVLLLWFKYETALLILLCIILGIVGIICLIMPDTIGGQWTPYGREYCTQWKSFASYVEDYSLIKESPPDSIKIWNKYLVYATALGVADNVQQGMEFYIPTKKLDNNLVYKFEKHRSYADFGDKLNKYYTIE